MAKKKRMTSNEGKLKEAQGNETVPEPPSVAIKKIEVMMECRVIAYTARRSIGPWDVIPFYSILEKIGHQSNLAVAIQSTGGFPDDAFKIAQMIREFADKVTFVVPSYANSAATLLCLSGDSIQMGPISEFGPTNPMMYVDERLITPTLPQTVIDSGSQQKPAEPRQRQMAAHAVRDIMTMLIPFCGKKLERFFT